MDRILRPLEPGLQPENLFAEGPNIVWTASDVLIHGKKRRAKKRWRWEQKSLKPNIYFKGNKPLLERHFLKGKVMFGSHGLVFPSVLVTQKAYERWAIASNILFTNLSFYEFKNLILFFLLFLSCLIWGLPRRCLCLSGQDLLWFQPLCLSSRWIKHSGIPRETQEKV